MKGFYESIKDFIYDFVDYIIMIGIVVIVIMVIGWRLDLLFAKDALDITNGGDVIVEGNNGYTEENEYPNISTNVHGGEEIEEGDGDDNDEPPLVENIEETTIVEGRTVKITIPSGSLPSNIGDILVKNGLVPSSREFVEKSQELNLDTKLKSGTFEIKFSSTVEDIVKIIAK